MKAHAESNVIVIEWTVSTCSPKYTLCNVDVYGAGITAGILQDFHFTANTFAARESSIATA